MTTQSERRKPATANAATFAEAVQLRDIEREMARPGLRLRFLDRGLEEAYRDSRFASSRLQTRVTVTLLTLIYDAFIIPEAAKMGEVLALSALLRFAVLTPAAALFVVLDWRGRLGRLHRLAAGALLAAPTFVSMLESFGVTNPAALQNFAATPFLQLAVLISGVGVRQAVAITLANTLLFACMTLNRAVVPADDASLLILLQMAIGICTVAFTWRIDLRDRQLFLSSRQASIARDALAEQNRMLARLSQIDALTGLGNRRCFDDTLAALWLAGSGSELVVTLVMLDIDCFKQFNDLHGHQAGDECLVAVARTIRSCLRDEQDTLVRYGGEEFAIVLPMASLEDGLAVAERVRQAVLDRALPHPGASPLALVSVSLGVASVVTSVQTAASLIEAADQCLYAAKRGGRNRVECRVSQQDLGLATNIGPGI